MRTRGIRILDDVGGVLKVTLTDILEEIWYGSNLSWLITFLDGMPNPEQGEFLTKYEDLINKSENGVSIKWNELVALSSKYFQIYETRILGAVDPTFLQRFDYEDEEEMIEKCDIVIFLSDCTYWEVYAKDQNLIDKLKSKFKRFEMLENEGD